MKATSTMRALSRAGGAALAVRGPQLARNMGAGKDVLLSTPPAATPSPPSATPQRSKKVFHELAVGFKFVSDTNNNDNTQQAASAGPFKWLPANTVPDFQPITTEGVGRFDHVYEQQWFGGSSLLSSSLIVSQNSQVVSREADSRAGQVPVAAAAAAGSGTPNSSSAGNGDALSDSFAAWVESECHWDWQQLTDSMNSSQRSSHQLTSAPIVAHKQSIGSSSDNSSNSNNNSSKSSSSLFKKWLGSWWSASTPSQYTDSRVNNSNSNGSNNSSSDGNNNGNNNSPLAAALNLTKQQAVQEPQEPSAASGLTEGNGSISSQQTISPLDLSDCDLLLTSNTTAADAAAAAAASAALGSFGAAAQATAAPSSPKAQEPALGVAPGNKHISSSSSSSSGGSSSEGGSADDTRAPKECHKALKLAGPPSKLGHSAAQSDTAPRGRAPTTAAGAPAVTTSAFRTKLLQFQAAAANGEEFGSSSSDVDEDCYVVVSYGQVQHGSSRSKQHTHGCRVTMAAAAATAVSC